VPKLQGKVPNWLLAEVAKENLLKTAKPCDGRTHPGECRNGTDEQLAKNTMAPALCCRAMFSIWPPYPISASEPLKDLNSRKPEKNLPC